MFKNLSSKIKIKRKILWAMFLPDFQNFRTQNFRKAYSLNKSLFTNDSRVNQSRKGLKLQKNLNFGKKKVEILIFRVFWDFSKVNFISYY